MNNMTTVKDKDGVVHIHQEDEEDKWRGLRQRLANNSPNHFAAWTRCGRNIGLQGSLEEAATCLMCLIGKASET